LVSAGFSAQAAEGGAEMVSAAEPGAHAEHKHEGLTPNAPADFLGNWRRSSHEQGRAFAMTNSMIFTWLVAFGIIVFARYATRQIKDVPDGAKFLGMARRKPAQFLESIIGHELVKRRFVFRHGFHFHPFLQLGGLVPGIGTIGWGTPNAQGGLEHISRPLIRGVNADLNMTLAMSLIFFACWIVWAFQANGFGGMILISSGRR